jgi:hypothetical protein
VVGTQHEAEFWNRQCGKYGARDAAGINVARVGNETAQCPDRVLLLRPTEITPNIFAENLRIMGIESPRNGWMAH